MPVVETLAVAASVAAIISGFKDGLSLFRTWREKREESKLGSETSDKVVLVEQSLKHKPHLITSRFDDSFQKLGVAFAHGDAQAHASLIETLIFFNKALVEGLKLSINGSFDPSLSAWFDSSENSGRAVISTLEDLHQRILVAAPLQHLVLPTFEEPRHTAAAPLPQPAASPYSLDALKTNLGQLSIISCSNNSVPAPSTQHSESISAQNLHELHIFTLSAPTSCFAREHSKPQSNTSQRSPTFGSHDRLSAATSREGAWVSDRRAPSSAEDVRPKPGVDGVDAAQHPRPRRPRPVSPIANLFILTNPFIKMLPGGYNRSPVVDQSLFEEANTNIPWMAGALPPPNARNPPPSQNIAEHVTATSAIPPTAYPAFPVVSIPSPTAAGAAAATALSFTFKPPNSDSIDGHCANSLKLRATPSLSLYPLFLPDGDDTRGGSAKCQSCFSHLRLQSTSIHLHSARRSFMLTDRFLAKHHLPSTGSTSSAHAGACGRPALLGCPICEQTFKAFNAWALHLEDGHHDDLLLQFFERDPDSDNSA